MIKDEKTLWALSHLKEFPKDINKCSIEEILQVPGIGLRAAKKIILFRKSCDLTFKDLKIMGVNLKQAKYFITCNGKHLLSGNNNDDFIKQNILLELERADYKYNEQLKLF